MAKRDASNAPAHPLQQALFKVLDDQFPRLVLKRLASKLAAQGLSLSASQRKAVLARIESNDFRSFRLPGRTPAGLKSINLRWTAEDTVHLKRQAARVKSQLPHLIKTESDVLAGAILGELTIRWKRQAAREERVRRGFRARLSDRWQRPLEGLAMMLTITREFSEMVGGRLETERTRSNKHLVTVLTRLHARACQVAAEVLALLREGFADGAMGRWRTLHEIAVMRCSSELAAMQWQNAISCTIKLSR